MGWGIQDVIKAAGKAARQVGVRQDPVTGAIAPPGSWGDVALWWKENNGGGGGDSGRRAYIPEPPIFNDVNRTASQQPIAELTDRGRQVGSVADMMRRRGRRGSFNASFYGDTSLGGA